MARLPPPVWRSARGPISIPAGGLVMGIVNVTPDSFSDGGRYLAPRLAVQHGLQLRDAGAHILDIGGESTRPGAARVQAQDEIARVVPVIAGLRSSDAGWISIDTSRAATADAALRAGCDIVNDISGLQFDSAMADTIAARGAACVLMHAPSEFEVMHQTHLPGDAVQAVVDHLGATIERALAAGIARECIALDPGLGFGKTMAQNWALVRHLEALRVLERPILVGASRKRMVRMVTGDDPAAIEAGTVALHTAALLHGASIVRTHDVVMGVAGRNVVAAWEGSV